MPSIKEPPLVDVKVSNPIVYLKNWWARVMGKEGVDFHFRIHPITAFLIAFGIAAAFFGVGRYSVNIPFLRYTVVLSPTPTPSVDWKETAYTGKLQYSRITGKFFLVTVSSEAITLAVPENLDLTRLIGKRIFAVGEYSKSQRLLKVADVKDLEILPTTPIPIPTLTPSLSPTPSPLNEPTEKPTLEPTISSSPNSL